MLYPCTTSLKKKKRERKKEKLLLAGHRLCCRLVMNPQYMRQVPRLGWGGAWGTQEPYCYWKAMTCSKSWKEPWVTWCHSANTHHQWPTDQHGQDPWTELQRCVSLLSTAPSTQGVGAIKAEMADNVSNRHGRQDFGDQGGRKEGTLKKKKTQHLSTGKRICS